jgi:hypothetical protein
VKYPISVAPDFMPMVKPERGQPAVFLAGNVNLSAHFSVFVVRRFQNSTAFTAVRQRDVVPPQYRTFVQYTSKR